MILIVDNYDSFTYNLYQMVGAIDPDVTVVRNDELDLAGVRDLAPTHVILSPGPGRPEDAGICREVAAGMGETPVLGVCLGHQAICVAFGATVGHASKLMHGKQSTCELDGDCPLFADVDSPATVARYHSLAVVEGTLPDCLRVTARADDGEVMAVAHTELPIYGLQFHPESIMTPAGAAMLGNFLALPPGGRW